jgi:RNA polymerase sigma-70 factor, ECF subfamily
VEALKSDDAAERQMEEPLRRAASGDARAFEQIVCAHQAMVFSIARHFLGDPGHAEELAQEVFLELYRNLKKIQSPAHLRFWLRRVASHRSIDWLRRQRPEEMSLADAPELAAPLATPGDPLLEEKLYRLLQALPERARMMVILRFQEGLELHEIAEVMAMPVNTVKSSLRRALAVMQSKLTRVTGGVKV